MEVCLTSTLPARLVLLYTCLGLDFFYYGWITNVAKNSFNIRHKYIISNQSIFTVLLLLVYVPILHAIQQCENKHNIVQTKTLKISPILDKITLQRDWGWRIKCTKKWRKNSKRFVGPRISTVYRLGLTFKCTDWYIHVLTIFECTSRYTKLND